VIIEVRELISNWEVAKIVGKEEEEGD